MPKKTTKTSPEAEAPKIPDEIGDVKNLPTRFSSLPIVWPVTEATIAQIREDVKDLTITGPEDKKGYQLVHTACMRLRGLRADIERSRKEQKADALDFGRRLDADAKEVTQRIEEIEAPLAKMKADYDAAEREKEQAAQRAKDEKAAQREQELADVGVTLTFGERADVLYIMSDEAFAAKLEDATLAYNLQKEREAEQQAELEQLRREKEEREEAERQRQAAEAERVAEERRKLDEDRRAFEEQQRKAREAEEQRQREERAAQDRKEAEERGRREAEERQRREAEQREQAERERQEREAREAAAKPDKDKMAAYIDQLRAVPVPVMETEEGKKTLSDFKAALRAAVLATV